MAELRDDIAAYDAMRLDLESSSLGKWVVFHNKASRGVCDLVALMWESDDLCQAQLVEVKGTTRSPWVAWGPAERQALVDAARQAGAVPLLAWWPPHGELSWMGEAEWPSA